MSAKKSTLVKSVVGQVRRPSTKLPDAGHVYGIRSAPNVESAGQVLQWDEGKQPTEKRKSAKADDKEPRSRSSSPSKISKLNDDKSKSPSQEQAELGPKAPLMKKASNTMRVEETVYGIKSKKSDTSMGDLLRGAAQGSDKDYPDVARMKRRGTLPQAKATKASKLLVKSNTTPAPKPSEFKMKRFQKIESKVKPMMGKKG